jgi:hypothetical protein
LDNVDDENSIKPGFQHLSDPLFVQQSMWMKKKARGKGVKKMKKEECVNHDLALPYVGRHFGGLGGEVGA